MSYKKRWKPNATQKAAFIEKMKAAEELKFIVSNGAIRKGCIVEFFHKTYGKVLKGEVVNESYGAKTGQHTFSIKTDVGLKLVKGRNLYDSLLSHEQGDWSKDVSRK